MRQIKLIAALLFATALVADCARRPPPTEPPFTGVWVGPLPVSATEQRTFAVQLHERAELRLIGHLLGGTSRRTLVGAIRLSDSLIMGFEMKDQALASTILVSGTVSGDTLTGTATFNSETYPVVWTRRADPLEVRNFIFAEPSGADAISELSIVQDGAGALLSGNFTADTCGVIACGGAVTSFTEAADGALTISLASDGACPGAGSISATFNAANRFYNGTWSHTNSGGCGGATTSGTLIGARDMGTRTTHIASVFSALGQLANDLESGATFALPYAPISDSYLHFGETAAAFIAARNAEVAVHPDATIEFSRVTTVRTVVPAGHNPLLPSMPVIMFADRRSNASGAYRDVDADTPGQRALSYIAEDAGAWRLVGNQVGEFDLPFAYSIGAERLLVPSGAPSEVLHLSLGGWGAHFSPQTGHLEGNAKTDMMAQYVGSAAALTELANGPTGTAGVCDVNLVITHAGEVCGVWGGLAGEAIRARMFTYRAPYAGTVTAIVYEERPRSASAPETHYFDNPPHWSVHVDFPGGLTIRFVHVGRITGAVRAGLIAATGIDPDTYTPSSTLGAPDFCPPSPGRCEVNVLGEAPFAISALAEIGKAQTDAAPIPGHPGYYRGQIGPSVPPWSQVEFFMHEQLTGQGADVCVYQYLPAPRQTALASVMTADMLNPGSLRYGDNEFVRPWRYRAEAELCNNDGYLRRSESDFSSIHAQLGGWFERASPGATPNEQFSIARIHQGAGAYSPTLYDVLAGTSQPTEYLIARRRTDNAAYVWSAPGTGALNVWYPASEVLELTSSSFTVKWREISGATLYQRAAYALDGDGLKIKWGAFSTTLAGAATPTLAAGEACNDATVLCYAHARP